MSEEDPPAKRMRLGGDGLVELSKEELITEYKRQESYIASLLSKLDGSACSSGTQSELEERLKQQQAEASRKEKVLLMQLTRKEQELQELATQLGELTKCNTPGASQLRSALLDPALNILLQRMRNQLDEKSKKLQQATDDMAAWKFTPDSQTGKRLMSKCRTLIQENQELGKQVSTGRTAQLEAELALQKKYSEELKASQDELNEFVIQLDEEVEGMQSTICALQQQLKEAKDELAAVRTKQTEPAAPEQPAPEQPVHKQEPQQEERTSPVQQVQAPESPVSEPGIAPTPTSPAPKSPPEGVVARNRTPSEASDEMGFATPAVGQESFGKNQQPWSAEEMKVSPLAEEGGPLGDERTAEGMPLSRQEEGQERTTAQEEEEERTAEVPHEQVRTFSPEKMETQEQHRGQEEEEGKTADQVTSQKLQDASPEGCQEQQDPIQQWDWEQQEVHQQQQQQQQQQGQHHQQQQQQQQEQDAEEEMMEIDSSKFENDSSSTECEVSPVDTQPSKPAGELTSSCDVSHTVAGGDSNLGFGSMTSDQGAQEPPTQYQGVDQTQDDALNMYESPLETKHSVEPSGNNDLGVVDSSNGKGTEGFSTEAQEVHDTSTSNQHTAVTSSQTEGVDNSTLESQVSVSKAEFQVLTKSAPLTLFSEVKVTAKKLPNNCSLSVVDYDTGSSSDEEDYVGDGSGGAGFVEDPKDNKPLAPTINHSPTNQSPESPCQNSSPDNSTPASPANNAGNMGSDISPLKTMPIQIPSGNGGSDAGSLAKSGEPRDSGYIEENGTGSVHNVEQVAAGSE